MKYLEDVVVNADEKYFRGYGCAVNNTYPLAKVDGRWLYLVNNKGKLMKMRTDAKHFHSFEGKEISELAYQQAVDEMLSLNVLNNKMEVESFNAMFDAYMKRHPRNNE